jgi:hypothetical protein
MPTLAMRVNPMTTPKRRWFRFSLGTMFVVVTLFGCWLGWNLHLVREREKLLNMFAADDKMIVFTRSRFPFALPPPGIEAKPSMPLAWRILGAEPIFQISCPLEERMTDKFGRVESLFPEALIFWLPTRTLEFRLKIKRLTGCERNSRSAPVPDAAPH